MPKRSKLLQALDDHKGRDYEAEKQQKQVKAAEKRKRAKKGDDDKEEVETKKDDEEKNGTKKIKKANTTSKANGKKDDSSDDDEEDGEQEGEDKDEDEDEEMENGDSDGDRDEEEEEEEEKEEEDIPLSDLSDEEREDVIPHQRLTINNSAAINTSLKRVSFITSQTPFSEHNSLVSQEPIEVPDPNDDLNRELAFYKVCQSAAITARGLLKKEGVPFTRPADYFAEMVKSDEHMGRIKKKLYDEAASKKASADARKQRDLKKFGKQVQVAKLQQRHKDKRETLEKINALKKKRKTDSSGPTDDSKDLFDVAIDDAAKPTTAGNKRGRKDGNAPSAKRQKKNDKFGFGGKKRHMKSGDAVSSGDLSNFSAKKMKGGASKRPGKSKRAKNH